MEKAKKFISILTTLRRIPFLYLAFFMMIACSGNDDSISQNEDPTNDDTSAFVDHDGDGVSTSVELTDGTDPNDRCSFVLVNQIYEATTQEWRDLDCDGDCKTNDQEVGDGTDPLDSNDYLGSGDYISEIISSEFDGTVLNTYLFEANGTRIIEIKKGINQTLCLFTYQNDQIKEITTFDEYSGDLSSTITYEYSNGFISSIVKDYYGFITEYTVEYDGNYISVHHPDEPPGLFKRRIELAPDTQTILKVETYSPLQNEYLYQAKIYSYDSLNGNLLSINWEALIYDPVTGEYSPYPDYVPSFYNYEYIENVINPTFNAFQKIVFPSELIGFSLYHYNPFGNRAPHSPNISSYYIFDLGGEISEYSFEVNCSTSSGNPIEVISTRHYSGHETLRSFIYQ